MFGYLMALPKQMDAQSEARYRALYCGLCRALGKRYGLPGRMTLRYDLAFLAGLLLALGAGQETCLSGRCPLRPGKPCMQVESQIMDYCADVNLLLAYYKMKDDWQDDHNLFALLIQKLLTPAYKKAAAAQGGKAADIEAALRALSEMEKRGESVADVPADCFGKLMGSLFTPEFLSSQREQMDALGQALGRLVYIMDAYLDLREDLKKGRYNPLTFLTHVDGAVLKMLAAKAAQIYEELPLERDKPMLDAVIYVGLWNQYEADLRRRSKKAGRRNAQL